MYTADVLAPQEQLKELFSTATILLQVNTSLPRLTQTSQLVLHSISLQI